MEDVIKATNWRGITERITIAEETGSVHDGGEGAGVTSPCRQHVAQAVRSRWLAPDLRRDTYCLLGAGVTSSCLQHVAQAVCSMWLAPEMRRDTYRLLGAGVTSPCLQHVVQPVRSI